MSSVIKIGNSYGTLISKKILDSLDIKLGDEIDLEVKDEGIFIKKHGWVTLNWTEKIS